MNRLKAQGIRFEHSGGDLSATAPRKGGMGDREGGATAAGLAP